MVVVHIFEKCQKCGSEMIGMPETYFIKEVNGKVLMGGGFYCPNQECNWVAIMRFDNNGEEK